MANEHNTVTWTGHVLTASDGKDYNIVAGTTTDDIPSRMVDGTLYYIYWDQKTPHKYNTIIASGWSTKTPAGKHVVSKVTGQAATAISAVASVEYDSQLVPGHQTINMTTITNQDSVTAAEISSVGTSVTTGGGSHPRLKFYTGGADAANGAHWLRGFTSNSTSDTTGKWYELENSGQAVNYYDGAATSLLLSAYTATGIKFYDGTATSASDGTTIAHYTGSGIKFYNDSGLGDANLLMHIMPTGGTRFYDGSSGYITMRCGGGQDITFYDGTTADLGGGNTTAIMGATTSGTGSTTSGHSLRFYNASGQGASDANKTVEFVGNGDANENGMYVFGSTASDADLSTIGTKGDSLIKFEKGNSYIGNAQAGSYDLNKYGYLGVYSYSSNNYLSLAAQTGTDLYLKTPEDLWIDADQIKAPDGAVGAPMYSFSSDPNTGMYQYADDQIGFAAGGSAIALVTISGLYLAVNVASAIEMNINASTGQVTKVSSSRRYKDNIADLDINTENIYDLRPVSFDWKSNGVSDFGYIAEEVHEILPELTIYDGKNRPEAVRYKQLSVLMLEELKKLREEVKILKEKN